MDKRIDAINGWYCISRSFISIYTSEKQPSIAGSVQTFDATSFAPDSAPEATTISTGYKIHSGTINMDITHAVNEVVQKKPDMGWIEAAKFGMNVGKAAMGTMTTTLLLAYYGG